MKYYLRVEAVNLGNFIEDTADLSTIRGGSLLLLESVREIGRHFDRLSPVSTGASGGLFKFDAADETDAKHVKASVEAFLSDHEALAHATFVADFVPAGGDNEFRRDLEKVMAKNRWSQWKKPTLIVPETNAVTHFGECAEDRIRPGVEGGDGARVSQSVWHRRAYGRKEKGKAGRNEKNFYQKQMERYGNWPGFDERFANDFSELTDDPARGNLHHKMAVIYADGNHFGKIQETHCITPGDQEDFDRQIKTYRGHALEKILRRMTDDSAYQLTKNGRRNLRMETLLWGGDEFIWVVPAWRGWDALSLFFETSKAWMYRDVSLTHAAGIVFCHHKAPIHTITALCRSLAESVKNEKPENRENNLFQYVVLESFDHIGQGLGRYRREQFGDMLANTHLSLPGNAMGEIERMFLELKKNEFPMRKIHAAARASLKWAKGGPKGRKAYDDTMARIWETVPEAAEKAMTDFQRKEIFGKSEADLPRGIWIHMAELWDYVGQDDAGLKGGGA